MSRKRAKDTDEPMSTIVGIIQHERPEVQPFASDDEAILAALRAYHYDLRYAETSMWDGPETRSVNKGRRQYVERLIRDREPNADLGSWRDD